MKNSPDAPHWTVNFSNTAAKQLRKLPAAMQDRVLALALDLEHKGPEQRSWRNYGLIVGGRDVHHCHLNSGPTLCCCVEGAGPGSAHHRNTVCRPSRQRELQPVCTGVLP